MRDAEEILAFWLDEVGPEGWYGGGPALDAMCRERFGATWEVGRGGALDGWAAQARSCLALLILLDQMPRNMFRDTGQAFASDARAREIASGALGRGFDLRVEEAARQFCYLPFMHSEFLGHQERGVRLFALRFEDPEQLLHARAHRAVIRRFGRFQYRNAALGRRSTAAEAAWLAGGGYKSALAEVA